MSTVPGTAEFIQLEVISNCCRGVINQTRENLQINGGRVGEIEMNGRFFSELT